NARPAHHRPQRPARHAGLRRAVRGRRPDPADARGRIPPALRRGLDRRRRQQGRRRPRRLVPGQGHEGRPRDQMAARPAPVVAPLRPHARPARGRRHRPHAPGRRARARLQQFRSAAEEARAGQLHARGRGGARSRRPRAAQDPLHLAGDRAAVGQGTGRNRTGHRRADDHALSRLHPHPHPDYRIQVTENTMKRYLAIALALAAALPTAAFAHKAWLLPSQTVVAGDAPWITVDAAVSNDLFYFNHVPLRLDNVAVVAPDGSKVETRNGATGKYRSVFDVQLQQEGTYRIGVTSHSVIARWQQDGKPRRWRGTAATFSEVPADANGLEVSESVSRVQTFVTRGTPGGTALEPDGLGLELVPVTHPNDLYAGEEATFRFQVD